jgi:hypothetical protein
VKGSDVITVVIVFTVVVVVVVVATGEIVTKLSEVSVWN